MFVRYRQTQSRLQASLIETRRVGGKVRHEHIASFGSVGMPPSVEDRLAFWQRLHERLAKLSNRLDDAARAKVLGDIHARIPMVTLDEQQAMKLENAKADERFWGDIHDMHSGTVEGHKGLIAVAQRKIADGQAEMEKTATQRHAAKERRERLERGEDVPGGSDKKPPTREDFERILRDAGLTTSDIQQCIDVNTLAGCMEWDVLVQEINAAGSSAKDRAEKAAIRKLLRRHAELIDDDE